LASFSRPLIHPLLQTAHTLFTRKPVFPGLHEPRDTPRRSANTRAVSDWNRFRNQVGQTSSRVEALPLQNMQLRGFGTTIIADMAAERLCPSAAA